MRSLFLAIVVLLASAVPASATFPGRNGHIGFSLQSHSPPGACGDGLHFDCQRYWTDAFTIGQFGKNREQLSGNDATESGYSAGVKWSPTGRRLAYSDNGSIVVAHGDGTNARTVAPGYSPTWSPDGRELAFLPPEGQGIWRLDLSTGTSRQVTDGPEDFSPDWSSKGVIAFTRGFTVTEDDAGAVYTVQPDGSGLNRITTDGAAVPSWSPDGRRIAFTLNDRIRVKSGSGGRSRSIKNGFTEAVWSPDGRSLALSDRFARIAIVRATGGKVVRSIGPRGAAVSAWQPLPR